MSSYCFTQRLYKYRSYYFTCFSMFNNSTIPYSNHRLPHHTMNPPMKQL